jgi:hypothetical protein
MLRASCCVIVDPPCRHSPVSHRTLTARAKPIGSTPGWLRKRLSSTLSIAFFMIGGISADWSHSPKLGPSETSTVPSAARTRIIWPLGDSFISSKLGSDARAT